MAQGVKAYQFSSKFKKEYKNLPEKIQKAFDQKLPILLQDISYPSLRIKRIQGTKNRWEGSITMKYLVISGCVTVTGPPASICFLKRGTTLPTLPTTFPNLTIIYRV